MKGYIQLIKNLPEYQHSFTTSKEIWEIYKKSGFPNMQVIQNIFGSKGNIEISRGELFKIAESKDYKRYIISIILWGYSSGMRGQNFGKIIKALDVITELLIESESGISDWKENYKKVKNIDGLGLSTYSKLLYFLKIKVEGYPSLIFDKRIIEVINKGVFKELNKIGIINDYNPSQKYVTYLQTIDELAVKYQVSHGHIEMFLFQFGLHLKRS